MRTLLTMEESRLLTMPTVSILPDINICINTTLFPASLVSTRGPEPLLPGLRYNQRQLFWVSAAQSWCSVYRDQALRMRVITGSHSPDKFRVQVKNFRCFLLCIYYIFFRGHSQTWMSSPGILNARKAPK